MVVVAVDVEHRADQLVPKLVDERWLEKAAQDQVAEASKPVDLRVAGEGIERVAWLVLPLGAGYQLAGEHRVGVAEGTGRPVEQTAQIRVGRRAHDRDRLWHG